MRKAPPSVAHVLAEKLKKELSEITAQARSTILTAPDRRTLNQGIALATDQLASLSTELDPTRRPKAVFDPGNPRTVGFFIALALTAQPRKPLSLLKLQEFYGSGVYAIYYRGSFDLYAPLRDTETPIYVGQAASEQDHARTAIEQGARLAARLDEHRKNITRATATLDITDFDYRALMVQTGWETGAEDYLIRLFKPIWNSQTKLVFGIGKHGDSSKTRLNKRSPWDTLHQGRTWAVDEAIADAKSPATVAKELTAHFASAPPFANIADVLRGFIASLDQT